MAGNAAEWVFDIYDVYPGGDPSLNGFGEGLRVVRGGDYYASSLSIRSANRSFGNPTIFSFEGFRCAMDAIPEETEVSQIVTPTLPSGVSNPKDDPVSIWKGISIMPDAIKGHQSEDGNSYGFTIDIPLVDAMDYYDRQLSDFDWELVSSITLPDDAGGYLLFEDIDGIRILIFFTQLPESELLVTFEYPFSGFLQ